MGDVVNLRTVRKRKSREQREREAEAARALHGRTKAERQAETLRRDKALGFLEGHRRDKPEDAD